MNLLQGDVKIILEVLQGTDLLVCFKEEVKLLVTCPYQHVKLTITLVEKSLVIDLGGHDLLSQIGLSNLPLRLSNTPINNYLIRARQELSVFYGCCHLVPRTLILIF